MNLKIPPRGSWNGDMLESERFHHKGFPPWGQAHIAPSSQELSLPPLQNFRLPPKNIPRIPWSWFTLDKTPELTDKILSWDTWAEQEAKRAAMIATIRMEWHRCSQEVRIGRTFFQDFPTLVVQNITLWAFVIQYSHIWKNIVLRWWDAHGMFLYLKTLELIESRQKNKHTLIEHSRQWLDPLYFTILQLVKEAHEKLP